MKVGSPRHNVEAASEYKAQALSDEAAAVSLSHAKHYKQACYFILQAMEKQICSKIYSLVNPKLDFFRQKTRSHSIDDSVSFLVEIIGAGDANAMKHLLAHIEAHVLGGIKYRQLHNNLRYPFFSTRHDSYTAIDVGEGDYVWLFERLGQLKLYLKDSRVM